MSAGRGSSHATTRSETDNAELHKMRRTALVRQEHAGPRKGASIPHVRVPMRRQDLAIREHVSRLGWRRQAKNSTLVNYSVDMSTTE
jgi:hypothetical protein